MHVLATAFFHNFPESMPSYSPSPPPPPPREVMPAASQLKAMLLLIAFFASKSTWELGTLYILNVKWQSNYNPNIFGFFGLGKEQLR